MSVDFAPFYDHPHGTACGLAAVPRAAVRRRGTRRRRPWSLPIVYQVALPGSGPCSIWIGLPIDVSGIDLKSYLAYNDQTERGHAQPNRPKNGQPRAGSRQKVSGSAHRAGRPRHNVIDLSMSEVHKEGGKAPSVVTVSTSTRNEANLETLGQGTLSLPGIVDLTGSADIRTTEITAKGTADIHVFKVPLGQHSAFIGPAHPALRQLCRRRHVCRYLEQHGLELGGLEHGLWHRPAAAPARRLTTPAARPGRRPASLLGRSGWRRRRPRALGHREGTLDVLAF